jgi:hypothetical protein
MQVLAAGSEYSLAQFPDVPTFAELLAKQFSEGVFRYDMKQCPL